ncbi:hypothetical protein HDV06_004063 [Boothiomyces sp. JEL0866]|nr:hypothetical protein HDV06_004063 [Boothiomyces sp. JEL0866]
MNSLIRSITQIKSSSLKSSTKPPSLVPLAQTGIRRETLPELKSKQSLQKSNELSLEKLSLNADNTTKTSTASNHQLGGGIHPELLQLLRDSSNTSLNLDFKLPETNEMKSKISWNRYKMYDNSLIFNIFGGQLESIVTCTSCQTSSTTYDTFWDLSIPVAGDSVTENCIYSDLQTCLQSYFKEELLDAKYKCSKCKSYQQASKKLSISRYPAVLVLHLKRFKTGNGGFEASRKLSHPIQYPLSMLNLSKYESQVCKVDNIYYNLISVSNHYGNLYGGHYTALTKSRLDDKWYDRNDSQVTVQNEHDTRSAYILFYERATGK